MSKASRASVRPRIAPEIQPAIALHPEDLARAVMYAVSQPPHVDVNELLVRPTGQLL